jgi:hypothetical protein
MSFISLLLGAKTSPAERKVADKEFAKADSRLRKMELHREEMRQALSEAMKKIIEDRAH